MVAEKRCAKCKVVKPASAFHRMSRTRSGLQPRCKECRSMVGDERNRLRARARYAANRVQILAADKARRADPEFRARRSAIHRSWRARNRRRWLAYMSAYIRGRRAGCAPLGRADREYLEVLADDPCSYCGGPCDQIDHIDALARGGTHGWENFTAACGSCNRRKNAKPLLGWLLEVAA